MQPACSDTASAVLHKQLCPASSLPKCSIKGLQSGLYSLLTPVLALAGASYLFAPGMSLAEVFG